MSEIPVFGEEAVARAIYMSHWKDRAIENLPPPYWENASLSVRNWVLVQARAATEAHTAALTAAGLKIVGREPDEAMAVKGAATGCTLQFRERGMTGPIGEWPAKNAWHAMWDAAPPYPPDTEGK